MLQASRGITGKANRGPVPLARGLQALELYLAVVTPGWLPSGWYHCDCVRYFLSQLQSPVEGGTLHTGIPSLERIEGGAL